MLAMGIFVTKPKIMKSCILLFVCMLTFSVSAFSAEDWGKTGHRATGEIAEKHLTNKAKRAIEKLLGGESLAFVSTYSDEIRSDERYKQLGPWHYVNFPFEKTYKTHPKSEKGDIIVAINACISALKNENVSNEDKIFNLKMLVHFIGDLHQPLHVGKSDDRGGNRFQVLWFNEETNLHTVWDTKMIESYNMSYSELAAASSKLSKEQMIQLQQGSLLDWVNESRELCKDVYTNTESGENLGYKYMYRYVNVVRSQIQKGGIRLAGILNDLFG